MSVALFNQFKEITDAARSDVSRHIQPMLNGVRVNGENDKMLEELYAKWQAMCRASAAALQCGLYPNELMAMPKMPFDDEEHQACRQMAAVIIERTIYDEFTVGRWFDAAVKNILEKPSCANHSKSCACQMGLNGWTYEPNKKEARLLEEFYKTHYDIEKDEDYVAEIRSIAKSRGITFEEEMKGWRMQREHNKALLAKEAAKKAALLKLTAGCVFIGYQDLNEADFKAYNLHGYYKVTKTAECYEFMLVETPFQDPYWRQAVADNKVTKVPLTKMMGVDNTSFEKVTADMIHAV
jgi:hypothetical protein